MTLADARSRSARWGEVIEHYADDHSMSMVEAGEALRAALTPLCDEKIVLFRKAEGMQVQKVVNA